MKVSIIIPLYNAEKYIAQTLRNAIDQTWQNIEIIVVDDGSTDQSLNIAKSFEGENVRIVNQVNKGAAAARNLALQYSTGDYVQYLDSDDLISADKIEKQLKTASECQFDPDTLITCKTIFFEKDIYKASPVIQPTDKSYDTPIDLLIDLFANVSFIPLHAFLTPQSLILKSDMWNEKLSANDDGEYFARVISNSKKVKFCNEGIAYYRNTPNSLSKQKSIIHTLSEYQALRNITEIILRNQDNEVSRDSCSRIFNWFIVEWFPENKSLLREVEKTMNHFGLKFFSCSKSRIYNLIWKIGGWRRAMLFSEFISAVKNQI